LLENADDDLLAGEKGRLMQLRTYNLLTTMFLVGGVVAAVVAEARPALMFEASVAVAVAAILAMCVYALRQRTETKVTATAEAEAANTEVVVDPREQFYASNLFIAPTLAKRWRLTYPIDDPQWAVDRSAEAALVDFAKRIRMQDAELRKLLRSRILASEYGRIDEANFEPPPVKVPRSQTVGLPPRSLLTREAATHRELEVAGVRILVSKEGVVTIRPTQKRGGTARDDAVAESETASSASERTLH
jgi:hypothetical protein